MSFATFITSIEHFSMPTSIPMSWMYILCVLGFPVLFHFFQIVWCHPCILGGWSFLAIYRVCIRLCIFWDLWLKRIMAIMNSKGDSASPWKIPLCVVVSTKLRPPAVNSTLQVFNGFLDEVYDFMWYFVHFETVYYPVRTEIHIHLCIDWQKFNNLTQVYKNL